MIHLAHVLILVLLLGAMPSVSLAQEVKNSEAETTREQRLGKRYQEHASEYEMRVDGSDTPLKLEEKPIFQWINPARVGQRTVHHGLVFAWTNDGRAEAIGTVFSVTGEPPTCTIYHELHSLSTGAILAKRGGVERWNTQEPGIVPVAVPDAPVPAADAAQRGNQMRALSRRFSGYSINYDKKRWDLKLLPRPLYRMPTSAGDVLDQGVFALISTAGTDPEVLIVLEARKVEGVPQWQYSVCRFTDLQTWVSLDDKEVWAFENGSQGPFNDADAARRYHFESAGSETVN